MLGQLKNKFFSLHEEITASVKQLNPTPQYASNPNTGPYHAGDELLEYWQIQWESIHMAQDQNGRSASRCDRSICHIQQKMQKQWSMVMMLENLVGQIPKMNEEIQEIMKTLGSLESLFGDVEISLLALEDTIDARELQERQLDQRYQLAMYQERRKAEFNELSTRLQSEYQKKKVEFDRKQLLVSKQRQRESQEKFDSDMRQFKVNGRLLQAPQFQDTDACLESVDLNEEEVGVPQASLEAFLSEEVSYDESSLLSDHARTLKLSDELHSSLESSSTEKDSDAEQLTPVDPGASNIDLVDEMSPIIREGLLSRTDSIYYTPDATSEKLEQL